MVVAADFVRGRLLIGDRQPERGVATALEVLVHDPSVRLVHPGRRGPVQPASFVGPIAHAAVRHLRACRHPQQFTQCRITAVSLLDGARVLGRQGEVGRSHRQAAVPRRRAIGPLREARHPVSGNSRGNDVDVRTLGDHGRVATSLGGDLQCRGHGTAQRQPVLARPRHIRLADRHTRAVGGGRRDLHSRIRVVGEGSRERVTRSAGRGMRVTGRLLRTVQDLDHPADRQVAVLGVLRRGRGGHWIVHREVLLRWLGEPQVGRVISRRHHELHPIVGAKGIRDGQRCGDTVGAHGVGVVDVCTRRTAAVPEVPLVCQRVTVVVHRLGPVETHGSGAGVGPGSGLRRRRRVSVHIGQTPQ